MKELKIINYEKRYHQEFKDISLDWLHTNNLYEKADDVLLDNPQKYIDKGGSIFLAHFNDEIVGTVSIYPIDKYVYEILKLGVVEKYRGLGIGRKLLQLCVDLCLEKGVKLITLETSSKLENAIKLYKKFRFIQVKIKDSYYESADVKMELKLK